MPPEITSRALHPSLLVGWYPVRGPRADHAVCLFLISTLAPPSSRTFFTSSRGALATSSAAAVFPSSPTPIGPFPSSSRPTPSQSSLRTVFPRTAARTCSRHHSTHPLLYLIYCHTAGTDGRSQSSLISVLLYSRSFLQTPSGVLSGGLLAIPCCSAPAASTPAIAGGAAGTAAMLCGAL